MLKFITEKLTAPPFNRNFNFITFDGLEPCLLLQILSDVLGELDPKHKIDIREEAPEQTTMRILDALRIFRYKVPTDPDHLAKFCEGLIVGDKFYIYPILETLLKNFVDYKKRAYLAKYLTKVQLPSDLLRDPELSKLYSEHEVLIETFKETHKQLELLKSEGLTTSEIRNDIAAMEEEKDQIVRRISKMKKKLEMFPTSTMMLDMARKLRIEREREGKVMRQLQEQRTLIFTLERKIIETRQQANDLRRKASDCTAQSLLNRLEEEVKVNQYLATDKQPKEIEMTKMYLEDLARVAGHPAMTHAFIDQLNQKLREVHAETNRLVEKRMVASDPLEDKVGLFRQQANIAANRKASTASALAETREKQLAKARQLEEVRVKLAKAVEETGAGVSKSTLGAGTDTASSLCVPKAEDVSEETANMNQRKGTVLEEMSGMVARLNQQINARRDKLAPLIRELRPLRVKAQELTQLHADKKSEYDAFVASRDAQTLRLDQEVRVLREEVRVEESRYHYLNAALALLKAQQFRLQEEMRGYLTTTGAATGDGTATGVTSITVKRRSYRDMYLKRISEQEALATTLKEELKDLETNESANLRQMKLWTDVVAILESKIATHKAAEEKKAAGGDFADVQQMETDRLLL
uniref:Intraflagellar transport protein 81 homolog n=1 Tax=Mesocestoides corti TaxID=53468 RepID=A0A5K3EWW8_MESCO